MKKSAPLYIKKDIEKRYLDRTRMSQKLFNKARCYLPGGDTRSVTYFKPYPIYIAKGKECYIFDVDGNKYLDIVNNYTSLILGHAHPKVVRALQDQAPKGTVYGAPIEEQYRLAQILAERFPSIEKLRFCNSGTEATQFAIRLARAISGKQKIMKMEGGYHGTHDIVEVSVNTNPGEAGGSSSPRPLLENRGIPKSVLKDVVVLPFNNEEALKKIINKEGQNVAAIIIEPVMGAAGMISPKPNFLHFIRKITKQNNILLIFDEIITFRLSPGGAQSFYGVVPDITTLGKCIGGGLPVGAFGATKELMTLFTPGKSGGISHSGTFNGNAMTMVAGLATLEELKPPVYQRLNLLGDRLKKKILEGFQRAGIRGTVTGEGSLLNLHFSKEEIHDFREVWRAKSAHKDLYELFHLSMVTRGIFIAPRGLMCISTPMGEREVDHVGEKVGEILLEIRPYIEEFHKDLCI